MSENISDIMEECWQIADDKGWHDTLRTFPEEIALIHTELSEALECYREGADLTEIMYVDGKPLGIPVELADVVIRVFDVARDRGVPLVEALREKMNYNQTREYRHGNKVL